MWAWNHFFNSPTCFNSATRGTEHEMSYEASSETEHDFFSTRSLRTSVDHCNTTLRTSVDHCSILLCRGPLARASLSRSGIALVSLPTSSGPPPPHPARLLLSPPPPSTCCLPVVEPCCPAFSFFPSVFAPIVLDWGQGPDSRIPSRTLRVVCRSPDSSPPPRKINLFGNFPPRLTRLPPRSRSRNQKRRTRGLPGDICVNVPWTTLVVF